MSETTEFDNPNDINSLTTLKIQTVSGNLSPQIFANGRNQLPIEITVKAVNKKNKPLKFSKETWIEMLNLRFAESDQKLHLTGNSGWCFSDVENEYSTEILVGSSRNARSVSSKDSLAIVILFVSTDIIGNRRIAVSVDTEDGKHFTTADNASGAEKMSVSITAIHAINYADKRNIMIINGEFVELSDSLGWTSRLTTEGPYKEHYNGTCKRRIVSIVPNSSSTGQNKFLKHDITYEDIKNNDVNEGSISWPYGINQPEEDCFALMQDGAGYPCAVIGRGLDRDDFQLNLWYSCRKSINVDGQVFLSDNSYYYRFCPLAKENRFGDNEKGFATLLLYKFTLPENNTYHWKWHNVVRPVTVKVIDHYGNDGVFELTFDDDDCFDTPGLV